MNGFKKYLSNTAWMVGGRTLKMILGFVATAIVARYLGPEKFGLLNYCFSLVGIAMVFVVMGLETIVVRELVKHPDARSEILGSCLVIQAIGVVISFVMLFIFQQIFHLDKEGELLILIGAVSLLFRPLGTLRFLFEANVEARLIALVEFCQAFVGIVLRILLVYLKAPLGWFALCISLEWVLLGSGFVFMYIKRYRHKTSVLFSTSKIRFQRLFSYSWPLLLSAATIILHQQVDRIMIKEMLGGAGNEQVGYYSAAIRLCMFVIFIPQMIASSLTPALVDAYKLNNGTYQKLAALFMDIMNWVGIGLSFTLFILAKPLILIAYGPSFSSAVIILQVVVWKGFFTATGMASGRQSTVENLQRYSYLRNLIGLFMNVGLNWFLIPRFNALGAAYATVASMFTANVLSHLLIPAYWHIFKNQICSMAIGWYRLPRELCRMRKNLFVRSV